MPVGLGRAGADWLQSAAIRLNHCEKASRWRLVSTLKSAAIAITKEAEELAGYSSAAACQALAEASKALTEAYLEAAKYTGEQ